MHTLCWKPKSGHPIKSNTNRIHSPNNTSQWISTADLRLKAIKHFVIFFSSNYHNQQEIKNCDIYIQHLLNKLEKDDICILLNHHNKKQLISSLKQSAPKMYDFYHGKMFKSNFSPLSHCIHNIGTSWKRKYKTNKYHTFLISKWIDTIKLLIKYNTNPFQCIYCQQILNVYDQYCHCDHIPTQIRSNNKMHRSPFKDIFKYFREDLHLTEKRIYTKHLKNDNKCFSETEKKSIQKDKIKYSNIHKILYNLLEWILNKYDIDLPLIRLTFGRIFIGLTPPYGDYEDKIMESGGFHTVLPTFPSYNILRSLLSIKRVIPFVFVTRNKKTDEPFDIENEENYILTSAFGIKLWNDCKVYEFVKDCPQKAFEIVMKYTKRNPLCRYSNYKHYELEFGFGSFYEDIVQYLAYSDPDLVKDLCESAQKYATQDDFWCNLKSKETNFWWKTSNYCNINNKNNVMKEWFIFVGKENKRISMLLYFCSENPYKHGIIFCKDSDQSNIIEKELNGRFNTCILSNDTEILQENIYTYDYIIVNQECVLDCLYSDGWNVVIDYESVSVSSYQFKRDSVSNYLESKYRSKTETIHIISFVDDTQEALYETIEIECNVDIQELPSDLNQAFFSDYKQKNVIPTYSEMSANELKQRLSNYDHNVCGLQDDFPIQWSVPLLFTIRSIYYDTILNAIWLIEPNVSECIISIILELSYCNKTFYDLYFGGYTFLCNSDNVEKCISIMKHNNMFINSYNTKHSRESRDVWQKSHIIPLKHRTNNDVIDSWLNGFKKHLKFRNKYFNGMKFLWNETEIDKLRKNKIDIVNRETQQYFVNVDEEKDKFDKLLDILSVKSTKSFDLTIVCEYNETAEKLLTDLNVSKISFSFGPLKEQRKSQQIWAIRTWRHTHLITHYAAHLAEWKHERSDLLILYDFPLDIDAYLSQINGYSFVCSLITNKDTEYKDKYSLNLDELEGKQILNEMIKHQKWILKNGNHYYIDVVSEQYKGSTIMDLIQNLNGKGQSVVFVNNPRKVHYLYNKLAERFKDIIICENASSHCNAASIFIVNDSYCNPHNIETRFVINYDLPSNHSSWIKRTKYGEICISFVGNEDDHESVFKEIESFCGTKFEELTMKVLENI